MIDVLAALRSGDTSFLDEELLHTWVVEQRWFAAKSREVAQINVLDCILLSEQSPVLALLFVETRFSTGTHDVYQVPVGLRPTADGWSERVIGEVDGWTFYDALSDAEHGRRLLELMRAGTELGDARFCPAPGGPEIEALTDMRPMGVEQSNTSIVFGDQFVLKAFRRLEPGDNPELELLRFLTAHNFTNIAPLAGWYEYEGRLIDATLGVVASFVSSGRDGWESTLDALAAGQGSGRLLEELRDLGRVTGTMHSILGSDPGDAAFAPARPTAEAMSLLTATLDEEIERVWRELPDGLDVLEPIRNREQDLRELLQDLSHLSAAGMEIRTHGDFHLGQTMLTDTGWVILDFEGEPARPLSERRLKRSPLRDVAGLLRSFSYAATAAVRGGADVPELWEQQARDAFLEGYFEEVDDFLLPPGQNPVGQLLAIFELEKAVYELRYELNNRPDWVSIPVAGILRLLEEQ